MKHVLKVKLQILTTLALLLFPMLHGWAGEITLVVENTTRVVDHRIDSEFKITNKGTDIAWNVSSVEFSITDNVLTYTITSETEGRWVKSEEITGHTTLRAWTED